MKIQGEKMFSELLKRTFSVEDVKLSEKSYEVVLFLKIKWKILCV